MSHEAHCPHCGQIMHDLDDFDWSTSECIETDCGHCCRPVMLHRWITVAYRIAKPLPTATPAPREGT